jgi:hypothetical protein
MAGDHELAAMETTLAALEPLDLHARQRVVAWLAGRLGLEAPPAAGRAMGHVESAEGFSGDLGSIKGFLSQKRPDDDVARVTTLAYYLTSGRNLLSYSTADLSKARVDAALSSLNMSRAVSNAQRAGYLTTTGKRGTYQITATGEALVEAMPNPALIKKVKADSTRRRRKSTSTKAAAANKETAKS